jgi:putative ABC transport system permease protein
VSAMHAIDRKLMRDFRRLWAQALAIALVLACGVAIVLISFGMYRALDETRTAYYERNRFADLFTAVRRAPIDLLPEIGAIPGVQAVDARVSGTVILDVPGLPEAAVGRILSLPETDEPILNAPILLTGTLPQTAFEIAVNRPFALANGLRTGDVIEANLNGRKRPLTISGTVLSPEFVYTIGPGAMMPDNSTFGILWMRQDAAAAAFDMTGAFNDLSLRLEARAPIQPVIDALDNLLEPYGSLGAYGRDRQQSNSFLDAEIRQLRGMATILPPVFFGISAFLVAMVMGRIVALERSEIGLLKALGYSDLEICIHYLMLAGLIAVAGIGIGWAVGTWLAWGMSQLYAQFFDFPFLVFHVSPWVYGLSGLLALLTTTLGAARSAIVAAGLAPAVAMLPPAPPKFRQSLVDRAMALARLSQPTIMILRSLTRWPVRSALTMLGVAMAVASVMASSGMSDAFKVIVDQAFHQSNRQDAMLMFAEDLPLSVITDVGRLPGVRQVEGMQYHSAILRNGPYEKRVSVEARLPAPDLSRVVADDGTVLDAPPGGILLSERLADQLHVTVGETVSAELLTGVRGTYDLRVTGIVTQYFGLGAYVDLTYINKLMRQSPRISVANVLLDTTQMDALHAAIKSTPNLIGTNMLAQTRQSFQETINQNVTIMTTIYVTIAVLITIGVTYNSARILLSERSRELASLRILGFSRWQVSYILIGETMLLAVLAQPFGWALGHLLGRAMTSSFSSDLYNIPLVTDVRAFAMASLIVLAAALGSVLIVRRRLDNLDLVEVMKTRE